MASTATAVAGLSVGALMLGRPVSQPVETIDLDRLTMVESRSDDGTATAGRRAPTDRPADIRPEYGPEESEEREIVRPRVIEDQRSDDAATSVATADDGPDPAGIPEPADSPASVDSPDSVDSD